MMEKYLKYKGKYYDVGTKVKIKTRWYGIQEATFYGWGAWPFRGEKVSEQYYSFEIEKYIVEIVEPVEVVVESISTNDKSYPSAWDVEIGWMWYIIIMVVGLLFKDKWIIWICATAFFFLWKSGLLKGGKKK